MQAKASLTLALSVLVFEMIIPAATYGFEPSRVPRADFWVPDGPVNALVLHGNTLYLGGQFISLRRNPQTTGVVLDFDTLTSDPVFPRIKGVVQAVAADGEGGFYLGGTFTSVGNIPRTNLAYVNRDGIVTSWNPGANGPVVGLALANGTLYVAGKFSVIGSESRAYLGAVDIATGLTTGWNPNPNGAVTTLVLSGKDLYAAGDFTNINITPRHFLAAWNTCDATLLPWNPNPQGGRVAALAVLGDNIFVGGDFTSIGG